MVDFIEEVRKGHGRRFFHGFQVDFFLIHQQLEAKKKAVVNLILPNHLTQCFGLFVHLFTGNFTKPACDTFL